VCLDSYKKSDIGENISGKNDKIDNLIELIKNKDKKTNKTIQKKRAKIKKLYKKQKNYH